MHLLKLIAIAAVTMMVVLGLVQNASGDQPGYVILSSPPAVRHETPAKPRPIYRTNRQAYAYGWFGASSERTFRTRSFGYFGRNTTWTFQ